MPKYYMGHTYTKKIIVYLKFKLDSILSGNLTITISSLWIYSATSQLPSFPCS